VDRQAGARVALAAHRRHVLGVAADPVLGAEERRQGDARQRMEQVGGVAQPGVDRGRVADQADPTAAQRAAAARPEEVEAGADRAGQGSPSGPAGARS